MKDIRVILEEAGLDKDKIDATAKEVLENYKSINEVEAKTEKIKELEKETSELREQIENAQGSEEEIQRLKATVEEYKAAEEKRNADEKEKANRDSFSTVFEASLDGKEFANDLLKETVFEKVYGMCKEASGLGAKEAIESVTKDIPGVWVNPQTDPRKMPSAGQLDSKQLDGASEKRDFVRSFFGSGKE